MVRAAHVKERRARVWKVLEEEVEERVPGYSRDRESVMVCLD